MYEYIEVFKLIFDREESWKRRQSTSDPYNLSQGEKRNQWQRC